MAKFVSNRNETVRLFKNPILEYFSHIHPATPIVVYLPLVTYLMYLAVGRFNVLMCLMYFILGIFMWTLTEYALHRWAFHYQPTTSFGKKVHFWIHGIHHDYPRDGTRLVMPLLASIPLAVIFYTSFSALFGTIGEVMFAGYTFGYIVYDSIHYATHHFTMKSSVGKFMKEYHLRHHYGDEHTAFGVSSPLWDYVFRTQPTQVQQHTEE